MLKKSVYLVIFFLFLAFTGTIFSQEETKKEISNDVLSADNLSSKTNAEDMADALKTVPGIFIREGAINIREASANKVLILIDGQRMNNAQSGDFDVTTIPIDAIENVKVLRGGNSARYGADAVGGVVNFITKKATEDSKMDAGLRATYGSFNQKFLNLYTSNVINDLNYYVSYKRTDSDGDFEYEELDGTKNTRENNYTKSNDVMVKLGYTASEKSSLTFSTQYTQSESGTPGSVQGLGNWPIVTPNAYLRINNMFFNLNYAQKEIFGKADFSANTYFHNFRTRYDDPDSWGGPTTSDHKNKAYGVELAQNNPLTELITLDYGYVFRHDEANSSSLGDKSRETHSGHLAATLGKKDLNFFFNSISIIPAVRYDAPDDFDKVLSPKVSLMFGNDGAYALNLNMHVSKSYRAPTFNDLYWPEDAYTVGNPDLDPEKGTSYEVGFGFQLPFINNAQINVNYFNSSIDDQIIWAPREDFKWTPTNVDKSETTGIESYIGLKFFEESFKLDFNHTYMNAKDASGSENDGKLLIYRPNHKLDVNAGYVIGMYELNANYQHMSKRYVNVDNSESLPDLNLVNANVSVKPTLFNMNWMFRLDLNNVLDNSYRLTNGYPMSGREFRFTVGLSLQ
jgi:outer membrane cobalamin receptor